MEILGTVGVIIVFLLILLKLKDWLIDGNKFFNTWW